VDEDKRTFVGRKILSTVLGGYRIVYDEIEANSIGIGLHVG
jgi:hypothetical protein